MLELRDMTKIYNAGTVTELTLFDRFNLTVEEQASLSLSWAAMVLERPLC